MTLAAAHAIAAVVQPDELAPDYVIPSVFDRTVAPAVADAVARAATARRRREAGVTASSRLRVSRSPVPGPSPTWLDERAGDTGSVATQPDQSATSSSGTAERCACGRRRARTSRRLLDFFACLSPDSVYQRFHGALRVTPQLVETFVDPDWDELGSLVGTLGDDGRIVALAEYVRLRDPVSAEVAFAVSDELQGRGIGDAPARAARRRGRRARDRELRRRGAFRQPADAARLRGRRLRRHAPPVAGEVELRFRIAPTDVYRERVDQRDHVAVAASLQTVLRAAHGGGLRRLAEAGDDRWRALPQHPRGRVRRRGVSRQPHRHAGRRRPRVHRPRSRSRTRSTSP